MQEVANEINKMKRASSRPLLVTVENEPLPQATSYKRMPEAGSLLQTRLKITSLHAESALVNPRCGLPEAPLSSIGI
jgi:hypothetical protein